MPPTRRESLLDLLSDERPQSKSGKGHSTWQNRSWRWCRQTVGPIRRPNAELRTREHLTAGEVESLIEAAKGNRHGHRDATMLLLAFRHGLRAAELVSLEWSQVDFTAATLHVRRVKKGTPATHPLRGDEMPALGSPPSPKATVADDLMRGMEKGIPVGEKF
jgi:integrase